MLRTRFAGRFCPLPGAAAARRPRPRAGRRAAWTGISLREKFFPGAMAAGAGPLMPKGPP